MNNYWFNKLLDVLMIQTNSENEKLMVLYLDKELKKLKLPYYIDAAGNIIVTKGKADTYPCVVSHMDTVHSFANNFKIFTDEDNKDLLFALNNKTRVGIGGDDKCGIFVCLYLLKVIPQIKVVFFSREEVGCKGSMGMDKSFFADCRYLIQLDRKGSKDFIQTYWGNKTVSHNFTSEIGLIKKKYKYKNATGTVTDVMKLWNSKVGISCVNLSCGYYKPHTDYEYISVSALWNSVMFTEEIVNNMKPKKYVSFPPKPTITTVSYSTSYQSKYSQCCKCKQWKKEALLYHYKGGEKICWPCKKELLDNKGKKVSDNPISPPHTLHNSVLTDEEHKNTVHLACHECGKTPEEMKPGDKLKSVNGELYCSDCASVFFVFDKKPNQLPIPLKCEGCDREIPEGHYHTIIQGLTVCGVCANELRDSLDIEDYPKECFVCNKVIPKDHRVIERFGVRVCEDCACPSDNIISDS